MEGLDLLRVRADAFSSFWLRYRACPSRVQGLGRVVFGTNFLGFVLRAFAIHGYGVLSSGLHQLSGKRVRDHFMLCKGSGCRLQTQDP